MRSYLALLLIGLLSCKQEKVRLVSEKNFPSRYFPEWQLHIYLPIEYHSSKERFPVIYMHDGQMLFDSTTTWNGKEWGVDETIDSLTEAGITKSAIIIGIWNRGGQQRFLDYFPQKAFNFLPSVVQDTLYNKSLGIARDTTNLTIQSDHYLKFLVEELKPYIDSTYRTLSDRENTYIAGSSMGGLISMYAICEYPQVFGGAACISTHWTGVFTSKNNPIPDAFHKYLSLHIPDPAIHKLYFDYGTETLDALYEPYQLTADSILRDGGYDTTNFLSIKFEGHSHDENAWKSRLSIPFTFLLTEQ